MAHAEAKWHHDLQRWADAMFHSYLIFSEPKVWAGFGRSPEFEWMFLNTRSPTDLVVLTPPLPVAIAELVARELNASIPIDAPPERALKRGRRIVKSVLSAVGYGGRSRLPRPMLLSASSFDSSVHGLDLPPSDVLKACIDELGGRALLDEEAKRALADAGLCGLDRADHLLGAMVLDGNATILPGVGITSIGGFKCNRCGSRGPFLQLPCARCGRDICAVCSECRNMGIVRECTPIYLVNPPYVGTSIIGSVADKANMVMPHALTPAQVDAARALVEWYETDESPEAIVWAVCGAGKTEVSYGLIAAALQAGKRVAYAAPRRDVVAELSPRIQSAFPAARCGVFYGGSSERYFGADITLLTTHQAMRFYGVFDLVIIDEADAFPYYGSEALAASVDRSLAFGGRTVVLTATPSLGHIARIKAGTLPCFKISARHHGHPLPMPVVIEMGDKPQEPVVAELATASLERGCPVLVFVPTRHRAPEVAEYLSQTVPDARTKWVHSGDAMRDSKRRMLAEGECEVLVSTSVMERGITVDGVDVIVADADWETVFDCRALVQMAGRVGRTASNPTGSVWFTCSRENRQIQAAREMIDEMNRDAASRGFLNAGSEV
ncbi:MAG: helicase-related protein [Bacillota bacterium]